jgi:hypothetical protein
MFEPSLKLNLSFLHFLNTHKHKKKSKAQKTGNLISSLFFLFTKKNLSKLSASSSVSYTFILHNFFHFSPFFSCSGVPTISDDLKLYLEATGVLGDFDMCSISSVVPSLHMILWISRFISTWEASSHNATSKWAIMSCINKKNIFDHWLCLKSRLNSQSHI